MRQSYHPEPVVEDIHACANISDLMDNGNILNQLSGISKPHVFHIKSFPGQDGGLRAGIYTKGLWSTPLSTDPWSGKPAFLLANPIDYTQTPSAQLRGPKPANLLKVKQGVRKFSVIRPDATEAVTELQQCLEELDFASDESSDVPFHWHLAADGKLVFEGDDNRGAIDDDGVEYGIEAFAEPIGENDSDMDIDDDDCADVKRRIPSTPIALGPGCNELVSKGKNPKTEKWFTHLSPGDFACIDVDEDVLPFYVGKVRSIFTFSPGKCPEKWKDDVQVSPETKFAEVHWWEPRAKMFAKGYKSNRLYPAIRQDGEGRCCDHIEVVAESSVLFCFQMLTSQVVKHGNTVSGILSKRVLAAVLSLKENPPATVLGMTNRAPLQMQTTVDMNARGKLQLLDGGRCPSFRVESRDYLDGPWTGGVVSRKASCTMAHPCYTVHYDDGDTSDYEGANGEARDLANEFDIGFFRIVEGGGQV